MSPRNLYAYVDGQVAQARDPSGLVREWDFTAQFDLWLATGSGGGCDPEPAGNMAKGSFPTLVTCAPPGGGWAATGWPTRGGSTGWLRAPRDPDPEQTFIQGVAGGVAVPQRLIDAVDAAGDWALPCPAEQATVTAAVAVDLAAIATAYWPAGRFAVLGLSASARGIGRAMSFRWGRGTREAYATADAFMGMSAATLAHAVAAAPLTGVPEHPVDLLFASPSALRAATRSCR